MLFELDYGSKVVDKYIDFDIDFEMPLEDQYHLLKEDLIQITYDDNHILDVGWYPEFSESGRFVVTVVRNLDWGEPIFREECSDLPLLMKCLLKCIKRIGAS